MPKKEPYAERCDADKIKAQWVKLTGLQDRTEWSAAVIRAATASEIAVNLAIRAELANRQITDQEVIDVMLKSANGLKGKFLSLLKPLVKDVDRKKELTKLWKIAEKINNSRDDIVHSGVFQSEKHAKQVIEQCHSFLVPLVKIYQPAFELEKQKDSSSRSA